MVDKIANAVAAQIYQNAGKSGASPMEARQGPSFGDMVRTAAQNSVDTIRAGEQASAAAVTGEATLQDVVGAITQAELTLETVVAVRDRLTSAYQEIMRMPI